MTEAGEHAQEFLELLGKLTEDSGQNSNKWKVYLAMRGVLPKIGTLIGKVGVLCVCVCVWGGGGGGGGGGGC